MNMPPVTRSVKSVILSVAKNLLLLLSVSSCTQGSSGGESASPTPTQVPANSGVATSMTELQAKAVDPVLFGEWHDLSATNDLFTSIHGIETWNFGKIGGKYLLDRNVYGSEHIKYLVQTNTTVTPHQLTFTVIYDFSGKIATGSKQLCIYNIAILTEEILTSAIFTRYQSIISLPRRLLQISCSAVNLTAFPTTFDATAQAFHNVDDGFNMLKENSYTQTNTSSIEIPFDSTNTDHKTDAWDKKMLIDDVRFILNFTGTASAAATQIYVIHEDGTELLVHDKITTDTEKFFRTVGVGGYPLDTSAWHGKALGDLDKYRLRILGFVGTDVPLFRVGIYPVKLDLKP